MPRLPVLILGVAGVLLTAGLSALVTMGGSLGAWLAIGSGALATVVGFGTSTRWVRERVPALRTFSMELARERDACLALRSALRDQYKSGNVEPWDAWRQRIVAWDQPFWQLLSRRIPDLWGIYRRETAEILPQYGDQWPREVLILLEGRWQLIKRIMEREQAS